MDDGNKDGNDDHEEEARQEAFLNDLDNLERKSSNIGDNDDDDDDDDDASDRSFLVNAIDQDLLEGNRGNDDSDEEGGKRGNLFDKELEMERQLKIKRD